MHHISKKWMYCSSKKLCLMDGRSDPFTWNSQLKKGPKTKNARSRNCAGLEILNLLKKPNFMAPFFMGGVQLPQGYSHFKQAVYFLPFSSQKFLVLNLSTSEGWKAESTLEPPRGFEHRTPRLGIQCLNH